MSVDEGVTSDTSGSEREELAKLAEAKSSGSESEEEKGEQEGEEEAGEGLLFDLMREEEEATTRKEEHTVRRVADEPGLSETYKEQLRKEFGYS